MTNPTLVTTPFAENGDKNTIPNVNSDPENPQLASNDLGFPPITQQKVSLGGIPPERNDFNGILNLYGQHIVHLNKGLPYEFDQDFADAIGGYPLYARIMLTNGDIVKSTVANNTTNPNSDMAGWVKANSASQIVDENGETQQVVNDAVRAYKYANYRYDARSFGIIPDKTTDWTTQILAALATLPESSTFYIPQGTLWKATSDPTSVYNAMPDNCVLLDDSGYESRYGTPSAERWQSSQQIYYKTKDYSPAGRRNGNTFNLRGNYNHGVVLEMDGAFGTVNCKATILWRFNNGTDDGIQIAGDGVDSTKAHLAFATYGVLDATSAFKMGLQSSIAPHGFFYNMDLVQDTSYGKGKRQRRTLQGTPETVSDWQSAPHTTRIFQPTGHTGTFTTLWLIGSAVQHREDINNAGDRTFTPKTSGQGTMVYTNLNELGGFKKRVITGSIGATVSIAYSNGYCSNYGAGGGQNITLPTPTKGLTFEFGVDAAQNLRIIPNSGANFIGKSTGKYMESSTIGSRLRLIALDSTTWSFDRSGTWVDEA